MKQSRRALQSRSALLALLALTAPLDGCGTSRIMPRTPDVERETGMQTCKPAKDPLHPFVVEWPAIAKTELEASAQRGPVVVSYAGCVLKVLPDCQAKGGGAYDILKTTPQGQSVAMDDASQLEAHLPVGAASLKGELSEGRRLTLDYVSVGQKVLSQPPTLLTGQCAGATHYVSSMVVGAFSLASEASLNVSAGAEVAGRGLSGSTRGKKQVGGSSGDVEQCKAKGAELPSCQGLLQLGLSPLELAGGGKVAAAGFGAGLGGLSVVPTLGQMQEIQAGGSLVNVDAALLTILQEAKRADRNQAASPAVKAAAWDALARYSGKNDYKDIAAQRRDDWTRVMDAERQRHEQVAKACAQYADDRSKLDKLLLLDEDVASKAQKAGYEREIEQVYAPWAADLQEVCPAAIARPTLAMRPAAEEKGARLAGGVHIDFARPDEAPWSVRARDGFVLCELPCKRWIGPNSGGFLTRDDGTRANHEAYALPSSFRVPAGASLRGQVGKPRGSVGGAIAATVVASAGVSIGSVLFAVGTGEQCYNAVTHEGQSCQASSGGPVGARGGQAGAPIAVHGAAPWAGPLVLGVGGAGLAASLVWLGWSRRGGLELSVPAASSQTSASRPPVELGLGQVRGAF